MGKKPRPHGVQTLTIEDIGPKGDGIARGDRGPVYIDRALPEDVVEARLYKSDDGVMRGSVERVVEASPFRIKPDCSLYERCGGCSLQHAEKEFYRKYKIHLVQSALKRAHLKPQFLEPIFCASRGRRRATFAAFLQNKKLVMGYYKRRSHIITDIEDCLVVHPDLIAWRDMAAPYLKNIICDSRPVDVFLQMVDGQCEIVITGPIGRKDSPDLQVREAAAKLVQETGIARLSWRLKPFDTPEIIIENKKLTAHFGSLSVSLPPAAFLQPTEEGERTLVKAVLDFLPDDVRHAADLFCGCGTFTGPLLDKVGKVSAFDIGGMEALQKAKAPHLTAVKRDLFKNPLRKDELDAFDAVVFDPPRAGAREQMEELARSRVKTAIGVSCNPATFARDARLLCDHGFRLEKVQIVDQFVWSHHVELVGLFTR